MSRKLLWKFLLVIATGTVALFYFIDYFSSRTESDMSLLDQADRDQITAWGRQAEKLYLAGDVQALSDWLDALQRRESTLAAVIQYDFEQLSGSRLDEGYYTRYNFGRNVDWEIHLHWTHNPLMEVPFQQGQISFLVILPDRMRPGGYWPTVRLLLQVFLPLTLMALLAILLYRHIMQPLAKLQRATRDFSRGDLSVRVGERIGRRNDELAELANTFDTMAARIGEQIVSQRQLIADLSHELRTPLARLDMAVDSARQHVAIECNLDRAGRESGNIRRLVEDALALAWLENERPDLAREDLDLVDLLDVIISDARFEFPQREILDQLPDSAQLKQSSHFAVGQAVENIVRNALRFTPEGESVEIKLESRDNDYLIQVKDRGPGVPEALLETIFQPFFRVDESRQRDGTSVGLGLSLARRQLHAVGGRVSAANRKSGGLCMSIVLPRQDPIS